VRVTEKKVPVTFFRKKEKMVTGTIFMKAGAGPGKIMKIVPVTIL